MSSSIEIVNIALTFLGEATINSFDDDTKAARLAKAQYASKRDAMLRSHPWNFAIKRDKLAVSTSSPDWEYDFAYTLPSDCLRVLEVQDSDVESWQWKVEGRLIVTDLSAPLPIKYIHRVASDADLDPLFVEAFAAFLAASWAASITGSTSLKDSAISQYRSQMQ